ncbi:hypothetical protein, partial [Bradyrhizobium sp.]|uniref:hypothetical protein n=1 Tax=Bradyrhizobium sp. TaxID=376 RepID=UPI0025C3140E
ISREVKIPVGVGNLEYAMDFASTSILPMLLPYFDSDDEVEYLQLAVASQGILQGLDAEGRFHRDRQPPR